jgi:hypothetical protein
MVISRILIGSGSEATYLYIMCLVILHTKYRFLTKVSSLYYITKTLGELTSEYLIPCLSEFSEQKFLWPTIACSALILLLIAMFLLYYFVKRRGLGIRRREDLLILPEPLECRRLGDIFKFDRRLWTIAFLQLTSLAIHWNFQFYRRALLADGFGMDKHSIITLDIVSRIVGGLTGIAMIFVPDFTRKDSLLMMVAAMAHCLAMTIIPITGLQDIYSAYTVSILNAISGSVMIICFMPYVRLI